MKCAIVIPARYASSRLPGKPLLKQTGKYLVQHVYEQAKKSKIASEVIIATDDLRIQAAAKNFGANCAMTLKSHQSGTDRVAEVAQNLDCDIFLNLQGDEPLIDPNSIDLLFRQLIESPDVPMATLATPINNEKDWMNPNCVKVVQDERGRALYFSRSPIPHVRDGKPDFSQRPSPFLLHIGMYAYRRSFLMQMAKIPMHPLEKLEKLEQLRVLGAGFPINLGIVEERTMGVDTREDYEKFLADYRRFQRLSAA
ncbi:MAG: 3-deoxy-manno-octulosonate cytidylyltransferase [Gemmataceae bacterium]|nr:3-deoxy-manno-octulosonate cytidylyltransferase [Gemmataceae bacterium]